MTPIAPMQRSRPITAAPVPDSGPVRGLSTRERASRLELRAMSPADRDLLSGFFEGLSQRSRQMRFAAPMPSIGERVLRYLSEVDGERHVAWGIFNHGELVAVGRFVRLARDPSSAEVALTVADAWQARGLGPVLLATLAEVAAGLGVERFRFTVSGDNRPAQRLLGRFGVVFRYRAGLGEGDLEVAELLLWRHGLSPSIPASAGSRVVGTVSSVSPDDPGLVSTVPARPDHPMPAIV